MFNWLFKKKVRHDLLPATVFNGTIQEVTNNLLEPLGFKSYKTGLWVKPGPNQIKYIFYISHYKGAVSAARWGVSLDFVPHFGNEMKKLYWHRTEKSVRGPDVYPFYTFDHNSYFDRFASPDEHKKKVNAIIPQEVEKALKFFSGINEITNLLPIFDKAQKIGRERIGYWFHHPIPLAHAFCLKVVGEHKNGKKVLNECIEKYELNDETAKELNKRFEQAEA
jgi:hypothetical protein